MCVCVCALAAFLFIFFYAARLGSSLELRTNPEPIQNQSVALVFVGFHQSSLRKANQGACCFISRPLSVWWMRSGLTCSMCRGFVDIAPLMCRCGAVLLHSPCLTEPRSQLDTTCLLVGRVWAYFSAERPVPPMIDVDTTDRVTPSFCATCVPCRFGRFGPLALPARWTGKNSCGCTAP